MWGAVLLALVAAGFLAPFLLGSWSLLQRPDRR